MVCKMLKNWSESDKKRVIVSIVVLLVFTFMAQIWTVDMAMSGYSASYDLCSQGIKTQPVLLNGFYGFNPIQTYHISLYGEFTIVLLLAIGFIWKVV